jgi:hypothetical protein
MNLRISLLLIGAFALTGCAKKTTTVTVPTTGTSTSTAWNDFNSVLDAGLAALTAVDPNLPYIGTLDKCVAAITKESVSSDTGLQKFEYDTAACSAAIAQSGAAGPTGSLIASGLSIFLDTLQKDQAAAAAAPAATVAKVAQLHRAVTAAKTK